MQRFTEMAQGDVLPHAIFFTDKSARPLAYMFRKLFPKYCPGDKMPVIRFINIGSGSHGGGVRQFTGDPAIIREKYGSHLKDAERILVVDEFQMTHSEKATIHRAKKMIAEAFPEAEVEAMVAYIKALNWYMNEKYFGVEEFTVADYQAMALSLLNEERKRKYQSLEEVTDEEDLQTFQDIYNAIEGMIPWTKPGKHIRLTYEREKKGILARFRADKQPVRIIKENIFRQTRAELDRMCEAVNGKRRQRMQGELKTSTFVKKRQY